MGRATASWRVPGARMSSISLREYGMRAARPYCVGMACATRVLGWCAMSGAALALVLGAAVIHATWNALAKRGRDPMAILWWAGAIGSLIMTPFALYSLWHGGASPRAVPFVVATVILHSVYFFTLARAYQSGDFSLVYPLARGLGVAIVPVAAFLLFDERLSPLGVTGIVLIGTGIFALNWRPGAWSEDTLLKPGTGWAIATGLCIPSHSPVDKGGV